MTAILLTRRSVLAGLALAAAADAPAVEPRLRELEREAGGRLGACVLDARGRRLLAHRADERFMLCSTFKLFLAGAVLARVDRGAEQLDRPIALAPGDIVDHSPLVVARLPAGAATVGELCEAIVTVSDNAAANLLLATIGGPAALTRYFRRLGGRAVRLDRTEPELNRRSGELDTTTPAAATAMMARLLGGDTLSAASQHRLEGWMIASRTGSRRLRAGLPGAWRSGGKTGSGPAGETNDLAFVDVPGRGRLLIAAYLEAPARSLADREAVLAEVGGVVVSLVARR